MLSTANHDRHYGRFHYVYPVLSRRSGGLSIGINLNPNNACNWRCIYCQVPNLQRGTAPAIDLGELAWELDTFFGEVLEGDFWKKEGIPKSQQRIRDLALSGNGESTSALQFTEVVAIIGEILRERQLLGTVPIVLITNGSLVARHTVREGLSQIATLGGEVWFKLDSATQDGMQRINQIYCSIDTVLHRLAACAALCPVWIQTCLFMLDDAPPSHKEQAAYRCLLTTILQREIPIRGVWLYGMARPSCQPEATRIRPLPETWLRDFAVSMQDLPIRVRVRA